MQNDKFRTNFNESRETNGFFCYKIGAYADFLQLFIEK